MKKQSHIAVVKGLFFGTVGVIGNFKHTGDCIQTIRRADGNGWTVADLQKEADTNKLIKIHRYETGLTEEAAKKLAAKWLNEGKAKAKAESEKPLPKIAEPFAEPPPEHPDPLDEKKTANPADRRDMEKAREKQLRKKWPRTFRAMDEKADAEAIQNAYLLDVAEFSGVISFPGANKKFKKLLDVALYNYSRRSKKTEAMCIDEAIVFHWPKLLYLDQRQFAEAIKNLTGIAVTPAQAKKRRKRLDLFSRCPAGRRPSS
jgi:hypothetical protein